MKIFQLCADRGIPPDSSKGASVHLRALARAWRTLEHEVETFTVRRATGEDLFPGILHDFGQLDERSGMAAPDLIYERYSLGSLEGLETARRLGLTFALEVNAPLVFEAQRHRPDSLRPEHEEIEATLLREADLVFAVSEPLRAHVVARRGTTRGTFVLPNGCDPELYTPSPWQRDGRTLVFLGHPKPWHGADLLAPLVAALVARNLDVRLLLIGGGPGADDVLRAARSLGVAERVRVTGPVGRAEAARLLAQATLALAPYPVQDFFYFCPLKVVEYMAAGLPIIASAIGDIPRLVGDAAVLIPPGDNGSLVEATASLLTDPRRRIELGRRARVRATNQFTWSHVASAVIQRTRALEVVPA